MFCTTNGCSCHAIQKLGEPHKVCMSCQGRAEATKKGFTCKDCGVGIWNSFGDYEGMNGRCSACHYGD